MTRLAPLLASACFAALTFSLNGYAAPSAPSELGLAELTRLDRLPLLRTAQKVGMVSSYDRTGGNDDGFSGTHSFIRKEGDALVLADLQGPGIVYRFYTPTPTDDPIEFYFDGESEPRLRLPFRKFFDGSTAPFLPPLAQIGSGGHTSYLPIPYAKSLKIVARAQRVQFYQINYARFPDATSLASFQPNDPLFSGSVFEKARALLARYGQDISDAVVPPGTPLHVAEKQVNLAPGQSATVFESRRGGRIAGLRFSPASAFAGRDRGIVLKITWDDAESPAVLCPAGDFFGFSWGEPAARSLLVGTASDTAYAYFPMPFDRSARIELVSERTA